MMSDRANVRFLHVANGTCTTGLIEAAGIPGMRSLWADPLYEGPVPAGVSDEQLVEVRGRYLVPPPNESRLEPANELRRWRQVIAAHDAYDELVLWFEHDLFDQLNLIQLLTWIRTRVPAGKTVSLVCIGSFPGRASFKGLGELSPDELGSLFETRRPISGGQYTVAERAWRSFREPSPESLDDLRHSDTGALPYLAPALERFLQEYPSTVDGLSRSERRLLSLADRGPIAVAAAFPQMHEGEHAYYITDASLAALVATLSRTSPALMTFSNADGHASLLGRTVMLTEAGRDVLAGRRDRVDCGIDRWLGGVHLRNGARMWRWDGERGRVEQR